MAAKQKPPERSLELAACADRLAVLLSGWADPRPVFWRLGGDAIAPERDDAIWLILSQTRADAGLVRQFPHVAIHAARPVQAMLLTPAAHAQARLTRIAPAENLWLHVCSHWPAPPLPQGLLEPDAPLPALPPAPQHPPQAPSSRLVALAERLMAMEEKLTSANLRAIQLENRLAQSWSSGEGNQSDAFFDVPRERHGWRLAEQKATMPDALGLYERRIDDPVILEARAGEAFLAQYRLDAGAAPDFAGAVRDLVQCEPAARIVRDGNVDVSIVIPVYGQLGYTLNCLHALLRHRSAASIEIIVVDDASQDKSGESLHHIPHIRYHRRAVNGGFIAAANEGIALARGRILVMLNNDTRVVAGWLDALIESFVRFPKAGLIGSKLHYPDGSLQEAGGIIWRDGSCWNYGCKDDPNRPQYCHAREVDYVSGCSIAVKTDLLREMGGFDPHYAPAYCEDADLCLRLAERGYEIWFQPQSRVVHYEGKTSGTDTSQGVKSYQLVNTKKLYLRWRNRLLDHRANGTAPYFERERKVRQRLLVIDAVAPTPKQDAGSVQTVLALQLARDLGYKVYFVPQDNFLYEPGSIPDLQAAGVECAYAPYEQGFDDYLRRYGFLFDVILVYRMAIFERTIEAIERSAPQATLLYHVADLHHLRMERQAKLENDASLLEQAEKTKQRELALAARAHGTITHSPYEAEILAKLAPEAQVTVWPLMFDFYDTQIGFTSRRDICFLGGYRHPPNVDAVQYFVAKIWPLVKSKLMGARFIIAGANPTADVLALAADDIIVTGQIEDLRDLFDAAKVFVAPLRVGAGVKGKVMTALSYGIPVVSTAIGLEGTGLHPEQQVLLADTPAAFAAQIIRAYHDEALWQSLSSAGLAVMREEFSPAFGAAVMEAAIERATHRRLGLPMPETHR